MTTTLRPAGPERRGDDGRRSRTYTVCVNSRPVGSVELSAGQYGPTVGHIADLAIDVPDRRRGRGTVAALASEEVLRSWGCTHALVAVPADAVHGLRMATSLGYAERNRHMEKALAGGEAAGGDGEGDGGAGGSVEAGAERSGEPQQFADAGRPGDVGRSAEVRRPAAGPPHVLPPGSVLRRLTRRGFAPWWEGQHEAFVATLVDVGMPREAADTWAAATVDVLMVDGEPAPGTGMFALAHDGTDVAGLWMRIRHPAWVYSVEVAAPHRGRGHGRTVMLAAENACWDAGARTLGLNVFVGNTAAVRLYASLGYEVVTRYFSKPLI